VCPSFLGGFQVQSVTWHCSGDSLILLGKEQLCLCYMEVEEEEEEDDDDDVK
jgi:hypothetical protein